MSSRLSCTTCMFYVAATRSCQATGAYVPKLPADHWRSCPRFALSREHDTVANRRIVARRDVVNAARAANAAEEQASKTASEGAAGAPATADGRAPMKADGVRPRARVLQQGGKTAGKVRPEQAALIMIDMQMGFISEDSSLCIAGAAASVEPCARCLETARKLGMRVFHVRREYAADGHDVEAPRYTAWLAGGKPLSSEQPASLRCPRALDPRLGEKVIVKPRYSAFFGTELHQILQDAGIRTLVLTGTTTPNCVRSTAYDALSLGYNVAVIEGATSSRSPKVQAANLRDMAVAGVQLLSSQRFENTGLSRLEDTEAIVRLRLQQEQLSALYSTGGAVASSHSDEALAQAREEDYTARFLEDNR